MDEYGVFVLGPWEKVSMEWLHWSMVFLSGLMGGWFLFDGGRAFLVGDYVTAKSGPRAGQLGPWAKLVSLLGIEPRSTLMKAVHLGLGVVWLGGGIGFALGFAWGWWGLLGSAIFSLWYLPFGTVLGMAQIVFLLWFG